MIMTQYKKGAFRSSMAGKKVSELTLEERTFYDQEFKYNFSSGEMPCDNGEKSEHLLSRSNLLSTMGFLATRMY